MKKRIVNPTYSYQRGGFATIGCTLEILSDDEQTVLASTSASATQPLSNLADIHASIKAQLQDYIDTYKAVATNILPMFPGATTFQEAVDMFVANIDSEVII